MNFIQTPRLNIGAQKIAVIVTFLLLLIVLPLYFFKVHQSNVDCTDFSVYYRSAQRAKSQNWAEIYSLKDGACPYRYAPPLIPLFRPLAELSPKQGQLLWYLVQYFCFGFGFFFIYKTLLFCGGRRSRKTALFVTCLGILFILRFSLDTFTIGQVSAIMFLGLAIGLYGWVIRNPILATLGVFVPALFKIGPGFIFGIFLSASRKNERRLAFGTFCLASLILGLGTLLWWGPTLTRQLWSDWVTIVQADSVYFDAAHYGSQSFKSFLLRGVNFGWLSPVRAEWFYRLALTFFGGGTLLFWLCFRARSPYGRGLFFSLGIFIYVWFMPETFKYSLTPLAIPFVFVLISLLAHSRQSQFIRFIWGILGFIVLTLPLAGKDIVGDFVFFNSQLYSLPFFSTLFLGLMNFYFAYQNSNSSPFVETLRSLSHLNQRSMKPCSSLPISPRSLEVSLLVPIAMDEPHPSLSTHLQKTLQETRATLEDLYPNRSEILLILHGNRKSDRHPLMESIHQLAATLPGLRILRSGDDAENIYGRGAALRMGFLQSRGKRILLTRAEQPCDALFFGEALKLLDNGVDLVRANRRHPQSLFKIPVSLLPLVYGRHRLGLIFNRLVRCFLPVQTTDTHSGTLALSWRLAKESFAVQTNAGFLFDLEISLTAQTQRYRQEDLSISLSLDEEKTVRVMIQETWTILRGLPRLAWRYRQGYYSNCPPPEGITADDWGLSPGVNQGILDLARAGVVRRVSLMSHGRYLQEGLADLVSLKTVELGLHFNLTYDNPRFGNSSPGKFLIRWLNPFQNRESLKQRVRDELGDQLEKLQDLGLKVHYFDGHHHIHMMPGMMNVLADLLHKAGIRQVRLPYDPALLFSKQAPITGLAFLARASLRKNGFSFLRCVYPQKPYFHDLGKLRALLARNAGAEVIVHPAAFNDIGELEVPDSYGSGRVEEYWALLQLTQQHVDQ